MEILNQYNGDGLRVGATVNNVAIAYVYDDNASLPVVLAEIQGESVIHSYYGLGMVAQSTQNDWSYPLHDALGSTRQVMDDQGGLTASYQYDPFGALSYDSSWENGTTTPFRFAGEQLDLSNLYYLRARYYDPFTGRFTQMDPFPGITVWPDTLNPYLYSLNNPVNWTDPSGRFIFLPLLIAAAIGIAIGDLAYNLLTTPSQCWMLPSWKLPSLNLPNLKLNIDWVKFNNSLVLAWDFVLASITTLGYGFMLMGILTGDPAGWEFGRLLAMAASALATVTVVDAAVVHGPTSEPAYLSLGLWGVGGISSIIPFAPTDLLIAWGTVYYDWIHLDKGIIFSISSK